MAEDDTGTESDGDRASEETESAHDPDSGASVGHDVGEGRTTAPMSPFTTSEVGIGLVVLVVGAVVAFGIPLLTTL